MKEFPKVGIIVCNSGASNSSMIASIASQEIVKEFSGRVGICSLPALANNIPRQLYIVKSLKHVIVIDGCHQECAKKIVERLGIKYDVYVNLEYDLGIKKIGPFTTFDFTDKDVERVFNFIQKKIKGVLE